VCSFSRPCAAMQPITGARAACPQPPHESGTRSLRSSADGQRTPMCRSACSTRCDVAGCYGCNELPWLWLEKPVPIHCIRVHPCSIQVVPTLMSQASGLTDGVQPPLAGLSPTATASSGHHPYRRPRSLGLAATIVSRPTRWRPRAETGHGFPKQRRVENRLLSERQAVVLQGKIARR